MEHLKYEPYWMKQVILNLWQENGAFSIGNLKANYNSDVLKSSLCEYSNSYILVRGDILWQILLKHK